jgi:DNA-binding transcriptional regulator/RsmH inhibitor MraZ
MPVADPDPEAPLFMGNHPSTVDGQWRITVPATWRFQEKAELYFRLMSDHLQVLPRWEINRFRAWVNGLSGSDRQAALAQWGDTTCQATVDQSGRLTLPREWAKKVGLDLKKPTVLVGAIEFFQIWSQERRDADENGLQARGRKVLEDY